MTAMDKFSYYDTLSNLIPGLVFLWALSVLGPFSTNGLTFILTGNTIVDPILLLAIAYVIGHLLQFLSKYSIEILIKKMFWNGYYFSEIFLIAAYKKCSEIEFNRYLSFAELEMKIPKEKLDLLRDPQVMHDENKMKTATTLSHTIYRILDAKSLDTAKGQKAQLQNIFHSFFRNLAMLFLILGILDVFAIILHSTDANLKIIAITVLNFVLTGIFLYQAKQRGEYYLKGLFWSSV
jgi:hypothetical protein